jgi:methylenetetrahydrofolate reductase (NADPH)
MPVTNVAQIKKFTAMCGAVIPEKMLVELNPIADDPDAVVQYGVDWATRQCKELLEAKVDGLHFYTLNKSKATRQIVENLRSDGALK